MYKKNPESEPICFWCLKDLHHDATLFSVFSKERLLCFGCASKIRPHPISFDIDGVRVLSYVQYDDHISQLLIQYKEHRDEALAPLFFEPIKKSILKKFKGYSLVPLPSSKEKVEQRGFHHLHRMIEPLALTVSDVLVKSKNVKQAKMTREEREHIDQIFEINIVENDFLDRVLLIDDVCTTGSSMRAAIRLLRPHCSVLKAITFAYHPLWVQQKQD